MGYLTSFHFFLVTMERLGSLVWVEKEMMAVNLEFKMHAGSEKKMGFERSLSSLEYIQQFKQNYSDLSHRLTDHELQDKLVLCVTIYLLLLAVKM